MSGPVKKRVFGMGESDSGASEGGVESESDGNLKEEIQVDFEGRSPVDSDYHGIKQLLLQLFLKSHINVSDLAELIIGQNFIGSVVKQSDVDEEDDDDEENDSQLNVFGVTTVVNITEKKDIECISQLRSLLTELCTEHGSDKCNALVRRLLSDESKHLGLIINERFINIPSQISVPLFESLHKEIKRACEKMQAYSFDYFILICKLHKIDFSKGSKKYKGAAPEVIWANAEESIIDAEAECSFEFCVKDECDSGCLGEWDDVDGGPLIPFRKVLFLPATKLESTILKIKKQLTAP